MDPLAEFDTDDKEKTIEAQGKIEKILQETEKNDNFVIVPAQNTRNVIIVGRTRTGKSTVIGLLQSLGQYGGYGTMFSETRNARLHSFSVTRKQPEQHYHINLIDTPGLYEKKTKMT